MKTGKTLIFFDCSTWMRSKFIFLIAIIGFLPSCSKSENRSSNNVSSEPSTFKMSSNSENHDTITFGSGCFWCTEAVFQSLEGVISATSGYMGGVVPNPTYKQICTGSTGHAEVVQIVYDTTKISFEVLLEAFWASHDPTTLNRQGNDVGTQYRSVIFCHNPEQRSISKEIKSELISKKVFENLIVTEISDASTFYPAEGYHQEYYELNGYEPYCQFVIKPKLDKFKKAFSDRLKKNDSEN
ncbi:MAG: peptide-methionine (S)-S-oxide reductase MsrA [Bacteroidota bacterium]